MNIKRVNAMVKIKLSIEKVNDKRSRLLSDLSRLSAKASQEDYNEYLKRIK